MATVDVQTYSMKEFQFGLKPEAAIGTKINKSMQLLNLNGDITIAKEVIQDTTQRSGVGRTLKVGDIKTTDKGGVRTTLSVPILLDTDVAPMILEGVTWVPTSTGPASVDVDVDYAPASQAHGAAPTNTNDFFTACMVSPITGQSRYWTGSVIEGITLSLEAGSDGGRQAATLTIVTAYYEAAPAAAPTGMTAYGKVDKFRYLYDLTTTKKIGGDDLIMNKFELSIVNAVSFGGFQGANGDPETITRAVNGGRIEMTCTAGVKYDSNTAADWDSFRKGDIYAIELSNHATWASATFGFKADYCKLTSEPAAGDTEAGAFQDLSFMIAGGAAGTDMLQLVP